MAAHGHSTVAAILVAAGSGERLGASVPKAFVTVAGRTLLEHAARRFLEHPRVRDVVIAAPAALTDAAAELVLPAVVVPGGRTRQESVAHGLAALAPDVDVVLVHDVARAFVPAAVIDRVLDAVASGADGVVPAVPVTDTIRRLDAASDALGATVDRATLLAVQTPQGFPRACLVAAHASADPQATDDATLVETAGGRVITVQGSDEAFKITVPLDLALAEAMASHE